MTEISWDRVETKNSLDLVAPGYGNKHESTLQEASIEHYIDGAVEKKLLMKLDLFLVPIIMLVYLSCFLDRSNIGNVKVAGMPKDIGATDSQFSTAVSIFFATYVTFETPLAILMKKLTPRYLLTGLCIIWSLVTIFSGFIKSIGGLYATRLILGACEAGLFPSLNIYLTMVYRREEQARRVSYLFACTALSGAFGGLLAYGILQMDGIAGVAGWRWLYYMEGILSILISVAVWFGLPNDPAKAYFLNSEEKNSMAVRKAINQQYLGSEKFDWEEVKNGLRDPKVYLSGITQFCQDTLLYGFSTFLPSIIKAMGHTGLSTQYLTIPVYIVGAIFFVTVAFISDRVSLRSPFFFVANIIGIIGYILLLTVSSNSVKYFATFLCAISAYTGPGLNLTWLNVNMAPHYRRATAIGLQQSLGNTAGIVAGQIYRTSPYKLGNSFSLGVLVVAQVMIVVQVWYLKSCMRKKLKIEAGKMEDNRRVRSGDWDLDFKYHY